MSVARTVRTRAPAILAALLASCSQGRSSSDGPGPAGADPVAKGGALYAEMCSGCHGKAGEGVSAPSLRNWSKGESALVSMIATRMPFGNAGKCTGDCAADIAKYILATFTGALTCDAAPASPRALRLLTRREYVATVGDLLGATPGAEPCSSRTFTFDPAGQTLSTVHLAGSFNGWAKTIAAGGWAMTWSLQSKTWLTKRTIPDGDYTYKLVLNESQWIVDPKGAGTAPDGFGGQNSTLAVHCAGTGGATGPDPTAGFPREVRPEGFAFDDNGPARVVTAVHVEQHLAAATALAKRAAQDLATLVPCDYRGDAAGCADKFVASFGRRALRRPLTGVEAARYRGLVVGAPDFAAGVTQAVRALLVSPSFLYRSEMGEPDTGGTFRLTPYEIASALSYMFWGTMPDAALFAAAESGELGSPAGLEKQARRLLADPRAKAQVSVFAEQWLGAENVLGAVKNDGLFPGFGADVRQAMLEETRRFVAYVVFDGSHTFDELLTADYTFLNEPLAKAYGVVGVSGPELRKTPVSSRAGILGQGSVLATTAHSDQTSPIRRGLFVRRALLCQEFGTPPPNAGGLPKIDPSATTRERFQQHSANAACASCHKYIDPVGFGFERFDPIGRLRDTENGRPIDSGGDMNDVEGLGTASSAKFESLPELGKTLAASKSAKACFAKQYFRFARGYKESSDERCAIDRLVGQWRDAGYDIRELMVQIALSPDFIVRRK